MVKVDGDAYGGGDTKPKLTPDELKGADYAVLTVEEAHTGIRTGDGRTAAFLVFKEKPEFNFWLNASGVRTLISRIGDDDDDWPGNKVPLVKVRVQNPSDGRKVTKYHVADDEEWDEVIAQAKKKTSRKRKKRG